MRSRSLQALVIGAVCAVAVGLLTAPSYAAAGDANCDNNELCLYKNANFSTGGVRDWGAVDDSNYQGNSFYACGLNCSLNENTSSLKNTRGIYAYLFQNTFGGGARLVEQPEGHRNDLSLDDCPCGGSWNDKITSHCWVTSNPVYWCG